MPREGTQTGFSTVMAGLGRMSAGLSRIGGVVQPIAHAHSTPIHALSRFLPIVLILPDRLRNRALSCLQALPFAAWSAWWPPRENGELETPSGMRFASLTFGIPILKEGDCRVRYQGATYQRERGAEGAREEG